MIPDNQIDLWSASLDADAIPGEEAYALLSADERARAERFHFPMHRNRFVAARGILRMLLGRYLGVAPESISFSYGSHGKPALLKGQLHFNASHSAGEALFAFSSDSPLGVDLELVRSIPDLLGVAASFCSSIELAALKLLPAEERPQAFFNCWTRKEALVKAIGQGLSYPLDQISVSFDKPARFLHAPPELTQWHFSPCEPGQGYLGVVVSRSPHSSMVTHRFSEI